MAFASISLAGGSGKSKGKSKTMVEFDQGQKIHSKGVLTGSVFSKKRACVKNAKVLIAFAPASNPDAIQNLKVKTAKKAKGPPVDLQGHYSLGWTVVLADLTNPKQSNGKPDANGGWDAGVKKRRVKTDRGFGRKGKGKVTCKAGIAEAMVISGNHVVSR